MFTKTQQRRMLDSEYVSELVIGHLHFPQNKKDDLDEYYRRYATNLPGAENVERTFDETLQALTATFPRPLLDKTRWYKKSDFYTLFLAVTRGQIPIIDGSLDHIHERLVEFSDRVSGPVRDGEPRAVSVYREAVERAATDRGRRVRREEALLAYLSGADLPSSTDAEPPAIDDGDLDLESAEEYEDVA